MYMFDKVELSDLRRAT